MLEFFGTIFSSLLGGGATGIIGVLAQRYFDLKKYALDIEQSKLKYAHEETLKKLDADIMAQEWASRTKIADLEIDGKTFEASMGAEPQRYSQGVTYSPKQSWLMVLLDFIRGLVRPTLTIYLCLLTTLIYFHARNLIHADGLQALSTEKAVELVRYVIGTILYLTTSCVLWWFGTRNKQKQLGAR